jgi:hypothetical protein
MTLAWLKRPPSAEVARQFQTTFNLNVMEFWSAITGFDLVAFDETLKTPDGVSLRDHIVALHGEDAAVLIERLNQLSR